MKYEIGQNITAMIGDDYVYGIILDVGLERVEILTPSGSREYPYTDEIVEILDEDRLEDAAIRYFHEINLEK